VPDDPYIDPVSGVLRNKLRLTTAEELAAAEREITRAALILIRESPVRAAYDLPDLRAIHQRIFGDIYEWASWSNSVRMAPGPGDQDLPLRSARPLPGAQGSGRLFSGTLTAERSQRSDSGSSSDRGMTGIWGCRTPPWFQPSR
jgi:hypothetical protein